MPLPSSPDPLHFGGIANNKDSASKEDLSLKTLSEQFAIGSLVGDVDGNGTSNQTADRNALDAAPYSISEFYDAEYLNEFYDTVVAQLSDGTDVTNNGYVDGESARISFEVNDDTLGNSYTAGLKLASDGSIVVSATETESGIGTKTIAFTAPSRAEESNVYYPFVSTGTYENADGDNIDHYDQLAGTNIDNVVVKYVNASSDTTAVTFGYAVSAGTVTGRTWTFGNASNGEGSARTPTTNTSTNTPSVTFTGTGLFPVDLTVTGNPSAARNTHSATQENVDIRYNKAIDSLVRDDDTINVSAVDGSNNLTIDAVSEGHSGTLYIGYDDNDTASDKTFTNSSEAVNTLYARESVSKNFTISSAGTYYIKAYHNGDTNATVGGQVIVAPQLSYSKTNDQTINVNQTQDFSVSSLVGNNKQVVISSEDSIGGATLTADGSATMTPGANNKKYTITFSGSAEYSQTNNQTSFLTVNPTVSVSVSPGSGTFYPTTDANSISISSATHGITPTTFTFTPSVTGNNITTYSWSITNFSFTSGGSSTQGAVSGKYTSGGSKSSDLTVSGTDSTSGTTSFDQSITTVTKAITSGVISGVLRQGSNIVLSGVTANYVQNMRVQRHDGSSYENVSSITSDISGGVTISSLAALERDTTSRNVRLIDTDALLSGVTITLSLGNATVLGLLPTVDYFSVSQGNLLGELELTWTTSNASTVSINNSIGPVNADDSTSQTGIGNNTERTYIITATNADNESVTDSDSATTINPSLTIPNDPSVTSWTKGDTGNLTIAYTKNFDDTVPFEMGVGLDTGTGGTVYQSINVSSQSGTITFNKNYMHGTSFGTVIDFRIGNSTSGKVVRDNAATFSDFSAPGQATNNNSSAASGTSINVIWSNGSNATSHKVYRNGSHIATVSMPGTSYTDTGLTIGASYTYRVDAVRDVTTTPNGSSVTSTKTTQGASFDVATFTWTEVLVYGVTMGSTSGTGFSTTQETAVVGSTSTSKLLYYRSDIQTLGSTTVSWKRAADEGAWSGGSDGKYFRIGASHIGIIDSSGETDANQYIANTVAIPIAPSGWSETSTGTTNIEMSWIDNSAIEDDFKIHRKEGSAADSGDTLAGTIPFNNTSFDNTGLSNNSAPTISAFSGFDSYVSSGNIVNRILFTASGIDDYELKFNTSGHSNPYSSTAISKTSSDISGGSINQYLLHSGVSAATPYYYQITAYKDGKTYYYAVYANNGGTYSTSAATGNATLNQVTSTSTTSQTSTSNASLTSPSDFLNLVIQDDGGYTVSSIRNWDLTGGYTTTEVDLDFVSGDSVGTLGFAASNSDSTPDSYIIETQTYNLGSMSGTGDIWVRIRGTHIGAHTGNTATYRVTVTHGTESDSADIDVTMFDEGGGGGGGR